MWWSWICIHRRLVPCICRVRVGIRERSLPGRTTRRLPPPGRGNPLFSKWSVATRGHGTTLSLTLIKYFARFKWESGVFAGSREHSPHSDRGPTPLRRAKLINCKKSSRFVQIVYFQTEPLIKQTRRNEIDQRVPVKRHWQIIPSRLQSFCYIARCPWNDSGITSH